MVCRRGTTSTCWAFLTFSTIHDTPTFALQNKDFLTLLKGGAVDATSHAVEDGAIEDPRLAIGIPPAPEGGLRSK